MTRMNPPTRGTPSSKALFWFLAWHKSEFKEPFAFATQKEIAEAAGISEDAVSRIMRDPPEWLRTDGRRAYIDQEKIRNTEL